MYKKILLQQDGSQLIMQLSHAASVGSHSVFYGQEPPSEESTTTECGVNYQLLNYSYSVVGHNFLTQAAYVGSYSVIGHNFLTQAAYVGSYSVVGHNCLTQASYVGSYSVVGHNFLTQAAYVGSYSVVGHNFLTQAAYVGSYSVVGHNCLTKLNLHTQLHIFSTIK